MNRLTFEPVIAVFDKTKDYCNGFKYLRCQNINSMRNPVNPLIFRISDAKFWQKIHETVHEPGGVYKLFSMKNGQRTPVNRSLGTDPNGILYIGKATSFLDRVINLKKSIAPEYNSASHKGGLRYKSNKKIASLFPYEDLHIEILPSIAPGLLESEELAQYKEVFGEVPPMNAI